MFKCGFCKQTTQPGQPGKLVVTKTRPKEYLLGFEDPDEKRFPIVSFGTEIAEEVRACPPCYAIRQAVDMAPVLQQDVIADLDLVLA